MQKHTAQIWDAGDSSFSASTQEDIAAATVAVLKHPSAAKNKYVYTSSFETTQNQILASVERLTGEKWTVQNVTTAEKVKDAKDKIAGGAQGMEWLMAQGTLAAASLFSGGTDQSDFVKFDRSSNKELGLKQRDIDSTIKSLLAQPAPKFG